MPSPPSKTSLFSESTRRKAQELQSLLQSGEKIPRETLLAFLKDSSLALDRERKSRETPATDVDFF